MSFINYTGKVEPKGKKYLFRINGEPNITSYYFVNIANPTIDNAFKKVFYTENEITRSFLNSILFPNSNKIIKVEFLPSEMPGNYSYYSTGSIRFDCLCRCKLTGKKRYPKKYELDDVFGLYLDEKEIIIDIEMQICSNPDLEATYFKYVNYLSKAYCKNKILLLALIYTPKVENPRAKGNIIYYQQEIYKNPIEIIKKEDCIIYQLNLNYCYKKIKEGEDVYILNKNQILDEQGIEWIKFFTIPLWCKSLTEQYFAFPPLDELSFENDNVCNALKILVFQDSARSISYESDYVAQNDLLEKINNYESIKEELDVVKKKYENLKKSLHKRNSSSSRKKKRIINFY